MASKAAGSREVDLPPPLPVTRETSPDHCSECGKQMLTELAKRLYGMEKICSSECLEHWRKKNPDDHSSIRVIFSDDHTMGIGIKK